MARRGGITQGLTIRAYRDSDEAQVVELVRELQSHEAPFNTWAKPPADIAAWYIQDIKGWCAKFDGSILVAERDMALVGYACLLTKCEQDGTGGDFAYLYALVADLVVTKTARGQGIGKALLAACEKIAREKERMVLRVGVLTGNVAAREVYENFGFKPHHMTLDKLFT